MLNKDKINKYGQNWPQKQFIDTPAPVAIPDFTVM